MAATQQSSGKIKISFRQAIGLLYPYVKVRIIEQIKSVAVIIIYLILFQTLVLRISIADAGIIAIGLSLVVLGLTFFMEGLFLGLMPLGEVCGVKLPQKTKLPVILIFAFILGCGATFAEPAIGILKAAGSSVKAWEAPLLFLILNKFSNYLIYSVGIGVGIAVVFGMLRFLYNWSLKPFIYILVGTVTVFSIWACFDMNMRHLTGLAWDCGAVTTGPVTVPLVLALGIGICRIVGNVGSGSSGFGVVTLASLFPILAVLSLGTIYKEKVPQPMSEVNFCRIENKEKILTLFKDEKDLEEYILKNTNEKSQLSFFGGDIKRINEIKKKLGNTISDSTGSIQIADLVSKNFLAAAQAIIPLALFLFLVLTLILREKLPRADEIFLGIGFALVGMGIFNIGIETGLAKLGDQVGRKVPSSFEVIELQDEKKIIKNFSPSLVQTAIQPDGKKHSFFYAKIDNEYKTIPYDKEKFNANTKEYTYIPTKGPLFGGILGIAVVLLFAFILGYGATLAEPALNALGVTVEEITIGTFKKVLLMQAVAIGVGFGIAAGCAKIIWNIPLIYMLAPPYLLLMFITKVSTEEFVNIGWDSAGVTTGPVTVPLVLAMGLGIGGQIGAIEGFGILAMASVCPILSVLCVGLVVTRRRKMALQEASSEEIT